MSDLNVKGNIKKNGNSVAISNPNLLINGDFRVNQRGASSYSTSGNYTVDRWMLYGSSTLTVNDDGTLKHTLGTNTYCRILQYIEFPSRLAGQTVTLSAKYSTTDSVTLYILKGTASSFTTLASTTFSGSGIGSVTATIPESLADSDGLLVCLTTRVASTSTTWYYAKLEIGEYATPFSPKPYAQELADCQRYYQSYKTMRLRACFVATSRLDCTLQLVTRMRTNPTVTVPALVVQGISGVTQSDFTFTFYNETDNIRILGSKSSHGLSDGNMINNSGSIFLTADAEMY